VHPQGKVAGKKDKLGPASPESVIRGWLFIPLLLTPKCVHFLRKAPENVGNGPASPALRPIQGKASEKKGTPGLASAKLAKRGWVVIPSIYI
jgi:hypothetical protein